MVQGWGGLRPAAPWTLQGKCAADLGGSCYVVEVGVEQAWPLPALPCGSSWHCSALLIRFPGL